MYTAIKLESAKEEKPLTNPRHKIMNPRVKALLHLAKQKRLRNPKETGEVPASIAGKGLSDPNSSKDVKTVFASALSQAKLRRSQGG